MNDKKIETRRERLKEWFRDRPYPFKERSYLSQMVNGKATIGERAARRMETACGMPYGYLDNEEKHEEDCVVSRDEIIKQTVEVVNSLKNEKAQEKLLEFLCSVLAGKEEKKNS